MLWASALVLQCCGAIGPGGGGEARNRCGTPEPSCDGAESEVQRALGTEATGRGRCKLEKAREGQHVGVSGAEPDS